MATITRRNIFRNGLAAATALALPATARAESETTSLDAKLDAFSTAINGDVIAMEVTGDSHAPYYLKGEVIFTKEGDHRPGADMVCQLKSGKLFIAELVHTDAKSAYLRGLKPGDRMQVQPWTAIKSLARIAATYRG